MQINIEKKHFYGILGFLILISCGFVIYAGVDTTKAYHDASTIQLSNGKSLQEAIDDGDFSGGSVAWSAITGIPSGFADDVDNRVTRCRSQESTCVVDASSGWGCGTTVTVSEGYTIVGASCDSNSKHIQASRSSLSDTDLRCNCANAYGVYASGTCYSTIWECKII